MRSIKIFVISTNFYFLFNECYELHRLNSVIHYLLPWSRKSNHRLIQSLLHFFNYFTVPSIVGETGYLDKDCIYFKFNKVLPHLKNNFRTNIRFQTLTMPQILFLCNITKKSNNTFTRNAIKTTSKFLKNPVILVVY